MSDSENNTSTQTDYLFENEFVYITPEGELRLKETPQFGETVLARLDPEADQIDEEIKACKNKFDDLEKRVRTFLGQWSDLPPDKVDPEEAEAAFMAFKKEELLQTRAIGDFKSLAESLDNKLEELKERSRQEGKAGESGQDESSSELIETSDTGEPEQEEAETFDPPEPEETEDQEDPGEEEQVAEDYYKKLAEKAEQLIELTDWPYVSMELDNIDNEWGEGPDPEGMDIRPYHERIDQARQAFEKKKKEHYEEQKRIKNENLEKKKELLKELKKIVDEENWSATREVGRIRNRWEQVKPLPSGKAEELQPEYGKYIAEFEDHKVDRLVKKKQKEEENLIGKLVVLDKMEAQVQALANEKDDKDWEDSEKEFNQLDKQWSKIGRVPIEKNQELWDRYHDVQEQFHKVRFKYDDKYRNRIEKFLSKKKQLIKEAEALVDYDDLADAAREVNKLHRRWKKVGNLPQNEENELWNEFKAATDAFNEVKSENIDELREQEEKNLEEKKKLIKQAEELKDTKEWDKTHQKLQNLMGQWKKAGPVPKRQSEKIWKKFKGAMDVFYDRRREHFKDVKKDRKKNLEEKKQILDKLKTLKDHDNPIKAVEEAKPLQEEFKKAGYVPIKHKNRMWKEYRETCDVIYDRFRAAKSAANVVGEENVGDFSTDAIVEIQKMQKEADRLNKEIDKRRNEVIQMEESLSYFKPSGKGNDLLDDVREKIQKAENEIGQKENRLKELEKQIDLLTKESEENSGSE
ncbi:MAG: DUF349 domain-containing protein [Balneolaceae bacterium]